MEVDRHPGAVRSPQHGGEGIILPLQSRVTAGEAVLAVDRGAVFHIGDPTEPIAQLFLEVVGCLVAPVRHLGVGAFRQADAVNFILAASPHHARHILQVALEHALPRGLLRSV